MGQFSLVKLGSTVNNLVIASQAWNMLGAGYFCVNKLLNGAQSKDTDR